MFSRHLFLLASSCRREKSNGGNVFFIVIQKKGGQVLFPASFQMPNTYYERTTAHAVILRFHMLRNVPSLETLDIFGAIIISREDANRMVFLDVCL